MRRVSGTLVPAILGLVLAASGPALGQPAGLDGSVRQAIDEAVRATLASTGAPGASIAIVRDGRIAYVAGVRVGAPRPARAGRGRGCATRSARSASSSRRRRS